MADNKTVNGSYIGRELKKEGIDKNKKEYKLFKTKFSCNLPGKDGAELSFGAFNTYTKGFDILEEGKIYTITYTEKNLVHPEHGPYVSKTAQSFSITTENKNEPQEQNTSEGKKDVGKVSSPPEEVLYPLEELYERYKVKIEEKDRDIAKFCQFYLAANHPYKYLDLKKFYRKREDKDMGEIIQ